MMKGKFGVKLSFIAVLAFVLVILNQSLLCGLLLLAAVFLERDEWLGRQTIQAFILCIVLNFFTGVVNNVGNASNFGFIRLSGIFSAISVIIWILITIFSILAIFRCLKGEDADVPILSALSYKAYGQQKPIYTPPPIPQQYYHQQSPTGPQAAGSQVTNPHKADTGSQLLPEQSPAASAPYTVNTSPVGETSNKPNE